MTPTSTASPTPIRHPVYKALHRPLTVFGVERRLFFLALLMGAATFTLCEGVVYLEGEDGTSRLLDLGNRFYGLSVVATQMLRATLDASPDAAVERLTGEYGVPPERVRSDLTTFLDAHPVQMGRKRPWMGHPHPDRPVVRL